MKRPFVTKDQLVAIANEFPTPFHLYDEAGIRANAEAVRDAFSWNPGFKEFFAVKANPNPALISILRDYGCGCDCSSATELMIAETLGMRGEDIMFSSNDTPALDFAMARDLGAIVNFDDISHIPFFEQVAGAIPRTVSCRFNPGGLFKLANGIMDNPGDSKYGMTEPQLFEAFRMLHERGAERFGIHAFLASNTRGNDYYPALARILFELAVRLERETGAHIAFINLSGGVGIPTGLTMSPATSAPSAPASSEPSTMCLCPQAWMTSPSTPKWAGLCWDHMVALSPEPSMRSASTKTISASTRAPSISSARRCTVPTTTSRSWGSSMAPTNRPRQRHASTTSPAISAKTTTNSP